MVIGSGAQTAAEELDPGKAEFLSSCAPCHGSDGRGILRCRLSTRPSEVFALLNNRLEAVLSKLDVDPGEILNVFAWLSSREKPRASTKFWSGVILQFCSDISNPGKRHEHHGI
jgi:hypothetical protein